MSETQSNAIHENQFGAWKKANKERFLVEKAKSYLKENPDATSYETAEFIGKKYKIKCSDATLRNAFDQRHEEEKSGKFSMLDLINVMKKAGVASGGIAVLQNYDKLQAFMADTIRKVLSNKGMLQFIGGMIFFYKGWLQPKIRDAKNDLSEIEILVQILTSQNFLYVALLSLAFIFKEPLSDIFEGVINFINTKLNFLNPFADKEAQIEQYNELMNSDAVVDENGFLIFPSFQDWSTIINPDQLNMGKFHYKFIDLLLGSAAITGYKSSRNKYLREIDN